MNQDHIDIEMCVHNAIEDHFTDGGMFTTADIAEITGIRSWDCSAVLCKKVRHGELEVAERVPTSNGFGPSCGYKNIYRLPIHTSHLASQVAKAFGFKEKQLSDYSDQELINELKRRIGSR